MTQEEKQTRLNELNTEILNLRNELNQTDYVVIRADEQGLEIAQEFKTTRQGWRDRINECEAEIARIEAIEPEDVEPVEDEGHEETV